MIVETKRGKLRGKRTDNGVVLFAGVPYAQPPVGELRWRAPEPVAPWDGVLDCAEFRHCAYQATAAEWDVPSPYGAEFGNRTKEGPSEDCLYLNIWTSEQALSGDRLLPVLCIIHGGGFESGSGDVMVLDGQQIAAEGQIVVTINYRLGIFGFFAHPELTKESPYHSSGNFGLLDQIEALRWIQENIAAFGGDPQQVTISGESAGAISVSALIEMPMAAGLFARASLQSCTHQGRDTYCPQISLPQAEEQGKAYMERFPGKTVDELRKMPTEEVFRETWGFFPFRDGVIWPNNAFESGNFNDVPVLLGSNSDEGSAFRFFFEIEDHREKFEKLARERYQEDAETFLARYPLSDRAAAASMSAAYGEKLFAFTVWTFARRLKAAGRHDVFYYYFDRASANNEYGAFHSSELPYLYGNLTLCDREWEEADLSLSRQMTAYLKNFVRSGDPNGAELPPWEAYNSSSDRVMELGSHVGMIRHPQAENFALYERHEGDSH